MGTTNRHLLVVLAASFALLAPSRLAAGQGSVYGPSAPGDSAFVRIIDAIPGSTTMRISLGATRFDPLAFTQVSPYRPVVPDIYLVRASGKELEVVAKSRTYYTIALTAEGIVLFTDRTHTDPARAQLFLYNLSSLPKVDLRTADGKTKVITEVAPRASGEMVVNAVSVALAVWAGDARLATLNPPLARGSSFSVFVLTVEGEPFVEMLKAEVAAK